MSLTYSNSNHVKVYNISGHSNRNITTTKWLQQQTAKALKKNQEWQNRIDLIQDFEFPQASLRLKITNDGKFCMATGIYKPQIRLFEFSEMSLKFERHTDYDNVNFIILSDDWTKSIHLQSNRTLEFHSHFGRHYSIRIPKFGRDLDYHYPSSDLYIGGATNDVFRLNLEQGRFLNPFITDSPNINKVSVNPAHQLLCFGGDDGHVEFWDPRIKSRITRVDVNASLVEYFDTASQSSTEVSALSFRNDGLHLGVGTSSGHVLLYDMRSPVPRLVKDHQYGLEIRHVHWHDSSDNVISADPNIIRIWNNSTGAHYTSIEPSNAINDICVVPDSGLLFVTGEQVQMSTYLIPELGPTPRFAQFLDHMTEEMTESQHANLYDNYKFVTMLELQKLNADYIIGTPAAKAYMHGYFIDLQLYKRIKAITNPFAYVEYKNKRIQDKISAKRSSRILATAHKPKLTPKVNAELADKLGGTEVVDDRFKDVFEDSEFHVDKESETYKLLNPVVSTKFNKKKTDVAYDSSGDEATPSTDAASVPEPDRKPRNEQSTSFARRSKHRNNTDDRIVQRNGASSRAPRTSKPPTAPGPSMTEVQTARSVTRKQPFGTRVLSETGSALTNSRSTSGALQMKFNVSSGSDRKSGGSAGKKGQGRRHG